MAIQFVTGNKGKFKEFVEILGPDVPLTQLDIDVPEIQSLDPREIIEHKLHAARDHGPAEYVVEDTTLMFDCFDGKLPGPFIKWFELSIGLARIAELSAKYGNTGASNVTFIGFLDAKGEEHFFESNVRGNIVPPRGDKDFGFGPIFEVAGTGRTYGEMDREEKYRVGSRSLALQKFREFLASR